MRFGFLGDDLEEAIGEMTAKGFKILSMARLADGTGMVSFAPDKVGVGAHGIGARRHGGSHAFALLRSNGYGHTSGCCW